MLYPNLYRQYSQRSSLFNDYPERFNCSLCHKIMIEPRQTGCGCRFCLQCIGKNINSGNNQCPNCTDEHIEKDKLTPDKAVEKEIMNAEMTCLSKGCTDVLPLKYLDNNLTICDYRSEQCNACQQWYPYLKRHEHFTEQCGKTVIVCHDCGEEITREDFINKHRNYENDPENVCKMWIRDCPYRCDEEKLFGMKIHLKNCPNKPSECIFKEIGCCVTGSGAVLKLHMEKDRSDHDILMMTVLRDLMNANDELKKTVNEKEGNLKLQIKQSHDIIAESSNTIVKLKAKVEQMERDIQSLRKRPELKGESGQSYKDIVVSNGQATWTIENIRQKIKECTSKGNNQIVSETFYVTRPGYHMSLKIYLNGDGRALNRYLSVFFVINRGDYDSDLSWPFKSKVTLSLLSNKQSKEDINVHMKPDNNQGCYGRPLNSNNIGAGQPEFVSLTDILQNDYYVHNGALKLRLSIDPRQ